MRCGFTLVELLVVVTIIAVLTALMLPALQSALESSRSVACQNNLKQIITACVMYADDHGGWLPATYSQAPWYPDYINGYVNQPGGVAISSWGGK